MFKNLLEDQLLELTQNLEEKMNMTPAGLNKIELKETLEKLEKCLTLLKRS